MRDIFWNWRFYKGELILEEQEGEKKKDIPPYVSEWASANGFTVLPLSSDITGFLGRGAQGKVFAMGKGDKEYAVKFSIPEGSNVDEEKAILQKIKNIQDSDDIVRRHTVNIYDIQEFTRDLTDRETGETKQVSINVFVLERLQPLSAVEKKYFDDLNVERTTFLNNIFFNKGYSGWEKIRDQYNRTLEQLYPESQNKNMLLDAFDKARDGLSKGELESIYFSPLETPTMVSLPKLSKIYMDKMLAVNPQLDKIKNIKDILAKTVRATFDKVFLTKIPKAYDDRDLKAGERMASFQYHNSGPMKSFHDAMLHLKNKYGISAADLRQPNVMKRGDDLVVSDLGFFK